MLARKLIAAAGNAAEDVSWDLDYAYYNGPYAWDISKASFITYQSISSQETFPLGLYIKPDGSRYYVVGSNFDNVHEYTVSPVPWSLDYSTWVQSFSVATQDSNPAGIFFKPDGTAMYITGRIGVDINQYSLSTAWDISTASYLQNFSVSTATSSPYGLFFKPDGLAMYFVGWSGKNINQYSLSTAWDISTASYVQNFSISTEETDPYGVFLRPDGLAMYVIGIIGDDVNEYSLSTAWDISTASYLQNFSVAGPELNPRAVFFHPEGSGMFVMGTSGDDINLYSVGGFSTQTQDGSPVGISFKTDGTVMYVLGSIGDAVYQYSLSTAWDISTASYVQSFSVATQETEPMSLFFKSDGTRFYISGLQGDDVNEYSLSTAWDISTATYVRNKSVGVHDTQPNAVYFKEDGTEMYFTGGYFDAVYQLSLSTAWDISTATYSQAKGVGNETTNPKGLMFNSDGTLMYVLGWQGNLCRYSLSTAWSVSTATLDQTYSVAPNGYSFYGLYFKSDGSRFYVSETQTDKVYSYLIGA